MTKLKSVKERITEAILNEIPSHGLSLEQAVFKFWFTGRQEGLRLTDEGMLAFSAAQLEYYDYEFKQDGQSYHSFVLALNKKIKCPYYLGFRKIDNGGKIFYIRLYDSKIAMLLGLYGNLQEYLQSIKE